MNKFRRLLLVLTFLLSAVGPLVIAGCGSKNPILPPKAPRIVDNAPPSDTDLYSWMENSNSELLRQYLQAENLHSSDLFSRHSSLQSSLIREFKARSSEQEKAPPVVIGEYEYLLRPSPANAFPDLFRRNRGETEDQAIEKVLSFPHGINQPELRLLSLKISPDNSLLGYLVLPSAGMPNIFYCKDLKSGRVSKIAEGVVGVEALNDGVYSYTSAGIDGRADKVIIGSIGTKDYLNPQSPPDLTETDARFHLRLAATKDGNRLFVISESINQSKLFLYELNTRGGAKGVFELLFPPESLIRRQGSYFAENLIIREQNSKNERLLRGSRNGEGEWDFSEFFVSTSGESIEELHGFKDYLVVKMRNGWREYLKVFDRDLRSRDYAPPDLLQISLLSNPNYNSTEIGFELSSISTPPLSAKLSLSSLQVTQSSQANIRRYSKESVEESNLEIEGTDGEKIGLKVAKPAGKTKRVLLSVYAAYGEMLPAEFRSERVSLFEREVGIATCEARGGGFKGASFGHEGQPAEKLLALSDLIRCAEWLRDNYSKGDTQIVIEGKSAGGLLAAAALNQRPELFQAAILDRPFLDPISVLSDKSLPLSARDVEEFGDPSRAEERSVLEKLSPYKNIGAKSYPPILVLTSYLDREVQAWESAKWIAKLRSMKTDQNPVILYTDFEAGHSGPAAAYKQQQELALKYSFILNL